MTIMSTTPKAESDAPVRYIEALTQRYDTLGYTPYRWYRAETAPAWSPLSKPMRELRLGVMTTSGCYKAGQVAFHYKDDTSIRRIASSTPPDDLRFSHLTENYLVSARQDPECLVPLTALRQLRDEGAIGSLTDDILSCMGGVYSQRRVRDELIPQIESALREQGAEAVLLIPM
jgi:D-proline reductase (dithiol) PrdB